MGNDGRYLRRAEAFEPREMQIAAKGQRGGMSSEWQVQAQLCTAVRERKWKLKLENKSCCLSKASATSQDVPFHPHDISHLSLYKKKDALPCRSPQFSSEGGGHGPCAAFTHLQAFGQDRSYCTCLVFCHAFKADSIHDIFLPLDGWG